VVSVVVLPEHPQFGYKSSQFYYNPVYSVAEICIIKLKQKIMQSEQNKIALVTGANTGVGFQIAKALVAHNYIVYVGARDPKKGNKAVIDLGENSKFIEVD